MAGVREKQKAQRRDLIEGAAEALFAEKGFNDATIEEIAERAVVSPATVYNYYGSKDELLLALVARGEVGITERLGEFIERVNQEEPADLVTDIILSNIEDTLSALSRELWGHVVAYIATTSDPEVAPRYLGTIADNLAKAIETVVVQYVGRGSLKSDFDPHYLAYFLTRIERIQFLSFVYLKSLSRADLRKAIHNDVAFLFENLRP